MCPALNKVYLYSSSDTSVSVDDRTRTDSDKTVPLLKGGNKYTPFETRTKANLALSLASSTDKYSIHTTSHTNPSVRQRPVVTRDKKLLLRNKVAGPNIVDKKSNISRNGLEINMYKFNVPGHSNTCVSFKSNTDACTCQEDQTHTKTPASIERNKNNSNASGDQPITKNVKFSNIHSRLSDSLHHSHIMAGAAASAATGPQPGKARPAAASGQPRDGGEVPDTLSKISTGATNATKNVKFKSTHSRLLDSLHHSHIVAAAAASAAVDPQPWRARPVAASGRSLVGRQVLNNLYKTSTGVTNAINFAEKFSGLYDPDKAKTLLQDTKVEKQRRVTARTAAPEKKTLGDIVRVASSPRVPGSSSTLAATSVAPTGKGVSRTSASQPSGKTRLRSPPPEPPTDMKIKITSALDLTQGGEEMVSPFDNFNAVCVPVEDLRRHRDLAECRRRLASTEKTSHVDCVGARQQERRALFAQERRRAFLGERIPVPRGSPAVIRWPEPAAPIPGTEEIIATATGGGEQEVGQGEGNGGVRARSQRTQWWWGARGGVRLDSQFVGTPRFHPWAAFENAKVAAVCCYFRQLALGPRPAYQGTASLGRTLSKANRRGVNQEGEDKRRKMKKPKTFRQGHKYFMDSVSNASPATTPGTPTDPRPSSPLYMLE